MEGRSVILSKAEKAKLSKVEEKERLAAFMARRKKNRGREMASLRDERLKLNDMSPESIGKK